MLHIERNETGLYRKNEIKKKERENKKIKDIRNKVKRKENINIDTK
jgi:hypothetical protein